MRILWIIFVLSFVQSSVSANDDCELTDEYKKEKWKIEKAFRENTGQCRNAILQANYWYAAWQCHEASKNLPIEKYNCLYDAAHKGMDFKQIEIKNDICKHFYHDTELAKKTLAHYVKKKGIKKCK